MNSLIRSFTWASCKSRSYSNHRDWWMCSDCKSNSRLLAALRCSCNAPCHCKKRKFQFNFPLKSHRMPRILRWFAYSEWDGAHVHIRWNIVCDDQIVRVSTFLYLPRCWSGCRYQRFQCAPNLLFLPLDSGRIVLRAHRLEQRSHGRFHRQHVHEVEIQQQMEVRNGLQEFIWCPFRDVCAERIEILQLTVHITIFNRKHVLCVACGERIDWY